MRAEKVKSGFFTTSRKTLQCPDFRIAAILQKKIPNDFCAKEVFLNVCFHPFLVRKFENFFLVLSRVKLKKLQLTKKITLFEKKPFYEKFSCLGVCFCAVKFVPMAFNLLWPEGQWL